MSERAKAERLGRTLGSVDARTPRMSMPPMALLAVSWWAASAISFTAAQGASAHACAIGAALGAGFAALSSLALIAARKRKTARALLLLVLGCMVGVSCGLLRCAELDKQANDLQSLPLETYRLELASDAREGDFGCTCVADLRMPDGGSVAVSLRYPTEYGLLRYGAVYDVRTRFSELSEESKAYYHGFGVAAAATADELVRVESGGLKDILVAFRESALALFDGYRGQGAAFLRAVLLGDRSELDSSGLYRQVKAVGLAHVVAVSGAHLSIVCMLLGVFLMAMRVPKRAVAVVQAVFVLAYLVCAGMPVSGVRAAIMTAVSLSSVYARRRSSGLAALAVCACFMLALSAEVSVSVSFALSVLSTAGIIVFGPLARDWCLAATGARAHALCDCVALTVSSGALTMPLSASIFAQLPLVSPLANLYVLPFFALFCGGGLVVIAVCCALPDACSWLLDALVGAAQGFCEGIGVMADMPVASIPCDLPLGWALAISGVTAALAWLLWPRPPTRRTVALMAALGVLAAAIGGVAFGNRATEVVMLDVGQGDAFVVRSEGRAVLVDTGNRDTELLAALARNGVLSLDAVVISHPDDDHCASLAALDGVIRVGCVFVADDLLECACASCSKLRAAAGALVGSEGVRGLSVGDELRIGAIALRVIWPDAFVDDGGNADSLCLLMAVDEDRDERSEWTGLFCGDAEDAQLDEMIAAGRLGKVDLYKVGHHGSKAAIDAETASVLSPSVSLVSAGARNRYGHPAAQTLFVLEGEGSAVYRTDVAGDVVCRMKSDALEVETLR